MKKKIGLALGSGSARGLAHIGILSVLQKNGIQPDYVAGTSIGAAVGALYCSGMSPEYMKKIAISTEWQDLLDITLPKTGVIAGNKIEDYIQSLTNNAKFSDLAIPLSVVACDIKNAHRVVFSAGNVARAVRASLSIPGVFSPVIIDSHELVDGGLVDPIPIEELKNMGADIIIAVDLSIELNEVRIHGSRVKQRSSFAEYFKSRFLRTQLGFAKEFIMETKRFRLPHFIKKYLVRIFDKFFNPKRLYKWLTVRTLPPILSTTIQSMHIMSSLIYKEKLKNENINVVITPELPADSFAAFDRAPQIIEAGEKAAEKAMPAIKKLLNKK